MTADNPGTARSEHGDGPALGEEARLRLWRTIAEATDDDGEFLLGDAVPRTDAMYEALEPIIAALLVQARADGAAEERERIVARVRSIDPKVWGTHYAIAGQVLAAAAVMAEGKPWNGEAPT